MAVQWSCASVTTHGCPSNVACANAASGSTVEYNRRSPNGSSQNNFFGTTPALTNRIVLGVEGAADFNEGSSAQGCGVSSSSVKLTVTVMMTAIGSPLSSVGANCHCLTAAIADASSRGIDLSTRTSCAAPSGRSVTSRITTPCTP